jgi:hypothetical protein
MIKCNIMINHYQILLELAACPLAKLVWRWRSRTDAARRARLQEGDHGTSEMRTKNSGMSISTLGAYSYAWMSTLVRLVRTRTHGASTSPKLAGQDRTRTWRRLVSRVVLT